VRAAGGEFYMVGSMGHALSIAQGVALAQPKRRVWCIDGDGAQLMHMGSLVSTRALRLDNLVHVLLNNSCHESVGGQRTAATQHIGIGSDACHVDFCQIARAAGYSHVLRATTSAELCGFNLSDHSMHQGSMFLELVTCVDPAANKKLGRPTDVFMANLKGAACAFLQKM